MAAKNILLMFFNWLFVSALLICLAGVVEAKYSGGDGSPENPYQIANFEDLMTLAGDTNDYSANFVLTDDIDLDPNLPDRQVFSTAVIAHDIDYSNDYFNGVPFTGIFDGAGHKILNLTIDVNYIPNDFLGLFGYIESGEIKNLGLENVSVFGTSHSHFLGGLAGDCFGNINNCYTTGAVSGYDDSYCLSGLVGRNWGVISNCFSSVNVTGKDISYHVGGLVGHNYGNIIDCCSIGTVKSEVYAYYLGGLVGTNESYDFYGIIRDCNSTASIIGNGEGMGGLVGQNCFLGMIDDCNSSGNVDCLGYSQYVGGLVGWNWDFGSINNCSSTDAIVSGSTYVGGLVGRNEWGNISNCYSTYTVTGGTYLGGFAGYNDGGNIIDCHSSGTVTGGVWSEYIGGLVGWNGGDINNCFSADAVVSGTNYIGGLIGYNVSTVTNCYTTTALDNNDVSMYLGGLVGYNEGNITNCHSAAPVANKYSTLSLGGLAGYNGGNINESYSTNDVTGGGAYIGGLVGINFEGSISNCYSTSTINSAGGGIGGLVGYDELGDINNCYSTGIVNGEEGSESIGGLVGLSDTNNISSSYFLATSGPDNGWGEPLTDEQMKQQSSFVGWDFIWETANGTEDIWWICEGLTYPKLTWQYAIGDSNGDGNVDFVDFVMMGLKWMQPDNSFYCGMDLTGDGWIDLYDLAAFTENWLQ